MTVESASFVSGLTPAYPPGSDSISEGDDHIRLIKSVLQGTFPNANSAVNGVHTGTSAPTSKTAGTIWYDTTTSNKVLKIYDGSGWRTLVSSPATDFKLLGATNVGWVLPTSDGSANQYLKTDGSGNLDWVSAASDEIPSQTGNSGKYLTTNGTAASWDNEVSSQTGNSGKFLTTDGSSTSWAVPTDTDTGKLLGVGHNSRSGYTDVSSTSMTDSGLAITYTKLSATSTLYVDFACEAKLATNFGWDEGVTDETSQTGYIRLVYATSTTTGISPATDDDANYIKEQGFTLNSGAVVQLGFGTGYIWAVTGLAAGANTFKVQGKVADSDNGSIEFVDGTIRLMEVEA